MAKQETPESPNLDQLAADYDILGELGARGDARAFIARRKEDGLDVVIVVARTPDGDQGNALSHLAADINLLSSLSHRNFLPIIDGRWVGTDAFAIIMQRTKAPTLHELLARRDEEFGFPRIAAVLREASGVLEWARDRKIVHRTITPETLFVEPGSDRVCVSFAISALPASGTPGADADARTIATLARAMFTRSPAAPERAELPLAELRPGLPAGLVQETEALLQAGRGEGAIDVTGYIARVAMAEALKGGEVHLEETRNAIQEQQRLHKEQLEQERREHEQQIAAERKEHEHKVADQAKKFAREREEFERELAKERKALLKEREALARERASHAKDCEALARERATHATDRATLLEERARHERLKKEERDRLAAEALALQAQAKAHAEDAELKAAERKRLAARPKQPVIPASPLWAAASADSPPRVDGLSTAKPPRGRTIQRPRWNRNWNVPAATAVLVLLIAITALALSGGARRSRPKQLAQVTRARIVDSASGTVAPYQSIVPLPEVTTDTAELAAIASDWTPPPRRRPTALVRPREESPARFDIQNDRATTDTVFGTTQPSVRIDTIWKRDTIVRPNAPSPTRRDSVSKVDTLPKRDTTTRASRVPSGRRR